MINLRVGSMKVIKGIEYSGIFLKGNSIRVGTGAKISINRSPFDTTYKDEVFLVNASYTYSFDKDTTISMYRVVNSDLDIVLGNSCPGTVDLVANTESATICSYTLANDIKKDGSDISAVAYVDNTSSSNRNVTISLKVNGTEVATNTVTVHKKTTKGVSVSFPLVNDLSAGDIISFTLKASGNKCEVIGAIEPSVIKINTSSTGGGGGVTPIPPAINIGNMVIGNLSNPLLDMPLNNNLAMKQGNGQATFTRAGTATYIDIYGVLQTAKVDEPRFEKQGLLMEGVSTNLFLNSEIGATQTIAVVNGKKYSLSVRDGVGSAMVSVAGTGSATKDNPLMFTATGTVCTITISGVANKVQFEPLVKPSSYIPTTTTPVTRAKDVCAVDYSGNVVAKDSDTTYVMDFDSYLGGNAGIIQTVFEKSENLYNMMRYESTLDKLKTYGNGGGIELNSPIAGKTYRAVVIYDKTNNKHKFFIDGVKIGETNTNYVNPNNPLSLMLGSNFNSSNSNLFGHLKGFKIYDRALTEEEARLC